MSFRENRIIWIDGAPTSDIYDDVYFSEENGLAETNHVFLEGNNLRDCWRKNLDFHIIETGFGTGLNFFASWKLWRELGCDATLNYTSVEKHPLNISDIKKAISMWPELDSYLQEFAGQYPNNLEDVSTFNFDNNKVQLCILWDDVNNALSSITTPANAWFLDGFSPAKNPDMWSDNLYKHMRRLTALGGTFATFTAAGNVRRGLQNNGFNVNKVPGFGRKRHILVGNAC